MKKHNLFIIPTILIMLFTIMTSQVKAGDIPETMLTQKDSSTFFGEIITINGDKITVEQKKNIKGKFEEGKQETYNRWHYSASGNPEKLEIGKTYLIGKINNNNKVYIWAFENEDLEKIKILSTDNMYKRLNEYLNQGKFTEENLKLSENTKTNTEEQTDKDKMKNSQEKNKNYISQNKNTIKYIIITVIILIVFAVYKKKLK